VKLSIECLAGRTDARVAVNHALLSVISFGNRNLLTEFDQQNFPKVLIYENRGSALNESGLIGNELAGLCFD
jgi:hypothetical protein